MTAEPPERPGDAPPAAGAAAESAGSRSEGGNPRLVALDLLESVLGRQQPLDAAIARHGGLPALSWRDRAFARLLVATVLRRLGEIDRRIDACLERPLAPKALRVRAVLQLGTAQILFLRTPHHAAVDTAVGLAEAIGFSGFKGLVNAVLRRIAREGAAARDADRTAGGAGRINTPDWLWQSWEAAYGEAVAGAIADMHLQEAPLDLTVRGDAAAWAARIGAELLPGGSLRHPAGGVGDVQDLPGYAEGAWWVQDAAAAIPARLLGDVTGRTVFDLCAAPGGKTAQLVAAGAQVVAVDRSAARLRRLEANLARLGLNAATVVADAAAWQPSPAADAVLLDAPCSATGTIRRHPDILRLKTPQDVRRLTAAQDRLLRAALGMVRPGGLVVYSVCSLQPEEGPERVAALLAAGAPARPVPISAEELPDLEDAIRPDGTLRTLPCHWAERGGMDGFYVARLRRT